MAKRLPRYFQSFIRHATPQKILNALRVEWDKKNKKNRLQGYPYKIIIDTCNFCNLRCRLCPTGMNTLNRPKGSMDFQTYTRIMDQLKPYAFEVSLHNWGEPFLNPDIFKMIEYNVNNRIGTSLSSNLKNITDETILKIVESGLEYLVVSIDGTSQEIYEQYRTGGNYERVIQTLNAIIQKKKALKSRTPFIEWQYLVMKHNEHQMTSAQALAKEIGVDLLRFAPAGLPFEEFSNQEMANKWLPENPDYWYYDPRVLQNQNYIINQKCFYLYRSITVNPDGGVSPCCVVYDKAYDFGNLLQQDLEEIWNNQKYKSARALFAEQEKDNYMEQTVCNQCRLFRKG